VGKKFAAKFVAGQQIGLWTVLRHSGRKRSACGQARHYWRCRCVCGCVKDVNQHNLASGRSKGCLVHKALTGRQFGKWTAVARAARGFYRCRCHCGNVATFAGNRLLRGEFIRCGCCEKRMNPHNKTGHRGVSFNKTNGKYRAEIRVNYKLHFLGNHATAELAARAYKRAARKFRHNPGSSSGRRLYGSASLESRKSKPAQERS
jgi:AP2 domain